MSLINIVNLTFAYDGSYDNIFENVSFQIDTDWKLGFIGRNGRGKTTFLNLLMGKYDYAGSISASVGFDYFPFELPPEESALDAVARTVEGVEEWRLLREISLLGLTEDILYRQVSTLSNGERTKLMLASLFVRDNRFLLIDEPTNHLDLEGRKLLADYLNGKKGFILVSHDRALLDGCVDHVLSINRGGIEIQKGNFSSWRLNREMADNFELAQNEQLEKDISRLNAAASRTTRWSDAVEKSKIGEHAADRGYIGAKSAKMMKRAKVTELRRERAAEQKAGLLKNVEETADLAIHPLKFHSDRLIDLSGVSLRYGERTLFDNLKFDVRQGERVSIQGKNGSGKSSLLKMFVGEAIPYTGSLFVAKGLKISYVPQDASFLSGSLEDYAELMEVDLSLFLTILRKMDFSRVQFEKDMAGFSGGQKKKTLIAASLATQAHVYIWDEPLNFIDVLSRIQIESLLLRHKPTMVFVEHDRAFSDNIATKTIVL